MKVHSFLYRFYSHTCFYVVDCLVRLSNLVTGVIARVSVHRSRGSALISLFNCVTAASKTAGLQTDDVNVKTADGVKATTDVQTQ